MGADWLRSAGVLALVALWMRVMLWILWRMKSSWCACGRRRSFYFHDRRDSTSGVDVASLAAALHPNAALRQFRSRVFSATMGGAFTPVSTAGMSRAQKEDLVWTRVQAVCDARLVAVSQLNDARGAAEFFEAHEIVAQVGVAVARAVRAARPEGHRQTSVWPCG
jgi:hypothetical protein